MNIKLELIFLGILGLIALISLFWIFKTEKRLKKFFAGKKAKDLEDTILGMRKEIEKINLEKEEIKKELSLVNQKLRKSIRGLEAIRFNPFPDQGSNQSFAIALLNEDGDGVVMSSLYSRERMSVFAKPIKDGKSEYEFSEEERHVVEKAKI